MSHLLSSEPRFPLLQNTDGNIRRQRLNWMQCLTREDPQEMIAVIKMPQHKAGSPQPNSAVCELCGFYFFKTVSLFIIFLKQILKNLCIYFWLAGSSLLQRLFSSCGKQGLLSSCGKQGLLSSCGVRASHCGGFSCFGAQALGLPGSGVQAQ